MRKLIFVLALLAQSTVAKSPYETSWSLDLSLVAGGAAVFGGTQFFLLNALVKPEPPGDPNGVNFIDRPFAGKRNDSISNISDYAILGVIAAPFAIHAVDVGIKEESGYWKDALVMGEAILLNGAVNEVVKVVVHRPRPMTYGAPQSTDLDDFMSFYSGHTSTAFAAGVSFARTYQLRHPESKTPYWIYGATIVAGGAVAAMRMFSGRHFPTDVLTGAIMGSLAGYFVPELHRGGKTSVSILSSPDGRPSGLVVSVLF